MKRIGSFQNNGKVVYLVGLDNSWWLNYKPKRGCIDFCLGVKNLPKDGIGKDFERVEGVGEMRKTSDGYEIRRPGDPDCCFSLADDVYEFLRTEGR